MWNVQPNTHSSRKLFSNLVVFFKITLSLLHEGTKTVSLDLLLFLIEVQIDAFESIHRINITAALPGSLVSSESPQQPVQITSISLTVKIPAPCQTLTHIPPLHIFPSNTLLLPQPPPPHPFFCNLKSLCQDKVNSYLKCTSVQVIFK